MNQRNPQQAVPQFSQPVRQIVQMLIVLILFGAGVWAILPRVAPMFLANPFLNGLIGFVFVIGVLACFLQVLQLFTSVRWIETFVRGAAQARAAPRLLAPLAALLRARGVNRQISATSANSILDSLATRIEEARDITRYLVNLLIFLGLLGTFYGLATTVPAVVETIRSLAPRDGESAVAVFARLMGGLEAQLGGMGTAFSSSLLGLAGSLVVGLLELFASRGQNRFYRELEEWLSSITGLGFAADGEGAGETGALAHVLDQIAARLETMQETLSVEAARRPVTEDRLGELAVAITGLTAQLSHDDRVLHELGRIAAAQEVLLARLAPAEGALADTGPDAEMRMRLRSIDVQMLRLLEELAGGRQEVVADLRSDLAALTAEVQRLRFPGAVPSGVLGRRD